MNHKTIDDALDAARRELSIYGNPEYGDEYSWGSFSHESFAAVLDNFLLRTGKVLHIKPPSNSEDTPFTEYVEFCREVREACSDQQLMEIKFFLMDHIQRDILRRKECAKVGNDESSWLMSPSSDSLYAKEFRALSEVFEVKWKLSDF